MDLYLIEKRTDNEYSDICIKFDENDKVSKQIQQAYNWLAGDVYAWPGDDICEEEIDKLFSIGKRFFILNSLYGAEYVVFIIDEKKMFHYSAKSTERIFEIVKLRDIIDGLCDHFDPDLQDPESHKALEYIDKYYEGDFAASILKQILGTHQQTHKP